MLRPALKAPLGATPPSVSPARQDKTEGEKRVTFEETPGESSRPERTAASSSEFGTKGSGGTQSKGQSKSKGKQKGRGKGGKSKGKGSGKFSKDGWQKLTRPKVEQKKWDGPATYTDGKVDPWWLSRRKEKQTKRDAEQGRINALPPGSLINELLPDRSVAPERERHRERTADTGRDDGSEMS